MEICLTKLHAVFQIALFYLCVLAWMRLDLFGGCQSPEQKNCNWSCFPFCSKTMRFFLLYNKRGKVQRAPLRSLKLSGEFHSLTELDEWGEQERSADKVPEIVLFLLHKQPVPKKTKKPLLPPFVPLCSIPVPVLPLPWSRRGLDNPFGSILVLNAEYYCSAKSYINLNCHLSPLTTPLISIFHLKKKTCLFLKTRALWPQQHPDFSSNGIRGTRLGIRICLH